MITSLYDFFRACEGHDWYFDFSDDSSVYRAGRNRENELRNMATQQGGVYLAVFDAFVAHRSAIVVGNKSHPAPTLNEFSLVEPDSGKETFTKLVSAERPFQPILVMKSLGLGLGEYFRDYSPPDDQAVAAYLWARRLDAEKLRADLIQAHVKDAMGRIYNIAFQVYADGQVKYLAESKEDSGMSVFHTMEHFMAYLLAVYW